MNKENTELHQFESHGSSGSNDGQKNQIGVNRYEQSEVTDNQSIFEKGDSFLASELDLPNQYKSNPALVGVT